MSPRLQAFACLVLAGTLVILVAGEALELAPAESAAHLASGGAEAAAGSVLLSGGMITYVSRLSQQVR